MVGPSPTFGSADDRHQAAASARKALRAARATSGGVAIKVPDAFHARLSPGGLIVASYVPIGTEADPTPFVRAAIDAGCIIALPHVADRANRPMRFLNWATEAALIAGPFGLHQPAADADEREPDIILTPLARLRPPCVTDWARGRAITTAPSPLTPMHCESVLRSRCRKSPHSLPMHGTSPSTLSPPKENGSSYDA